MIRRSMRCLSLPRLSLGDDLILDISNQVCTRSTRGSFDCQPHNAHRTREAAYLSFLNYYRL
jgi:hypothetical protein